jgi:hypothetical protein
MIEILMIIALARHVGTRLRRKGRSPGLFQLLAVILWVGGELVGIAIGASAQLGALTYLLALLGAASGACLSIAIANAAAPDPTYRGDLDEAFE